MSKADEAELTLWFAEAVLVFLYSMLLDLLRQVCLVEKKGLFPGATSKYRVRSFDS